MWRAPSIELGESTCYIVAFSRPFRGWLQNLRTSACTVSSRRPPKVENATIHAGKYSTPHCTLRELD